MNKLELTDEQLLLERILNAMSDKFDMNYDKLSDEIKKMFKEEKI